MQSAADRLLILEQEVAQCQNCPLGKLRQNPVFGKGSATASLMLIGEGPGADEDRIGQPFVGRAGQLLDRIIEAAQLPFDDLYICNVVKCRPPNNRLPQAEEVDACKGYLREQIRLIHPHIIVCLGSLATQLVVANDAKITRDRGKWVRKGAFMIMPTFHPAALLRDESKKILVWQDMQAVRDQYRQIKGIAPQEKWPPEE